MILRPKRGRTAERRGQRVRPSRNYGRRLHAKKVDRLLRRANLDVQAREEQQPVQIDIMRRGERRKRWLGRDDGGCDK